MLIKNDHFTLEKNDKIGGFNLRSLSSFHFWTKMTIKLKPQGPRCKKFEFWTKVAKVTKPQGPKWQFTQLQKIETFELYVKNQTNQRV
ncbi:hypothetical protein Hanom_Chr01g00010251 [Helianthus anomalus]